MPDQTGCRKIKLKREGQGVKSHVRAIGVCVFITNCVLLCLTVLRHIVEHQDIKNKKNSKSRKKRKQNNEEEEEQGES